MLGKWVNIEQKCLNNPTGRKLISPLEFNPKFILKVFTFTEVVVVVIGAGGGGGGCGEDESDKAGGGGGGGGGGGSDGGGGGRDSSTFDSLLSSHKSEAFDFGVEEVEVSVDSSLIKKLFELIYSIYR